MKRKKSTANPIVCDAVLVMYEDGSRDLLYIFHGVYHIELFSSSGARVLTKTVPTEAVDRLRGRKALSPLS